MDKYLVGQEHTIECGQEVGCMLVHGGRKNEVLVGDSSVGVDCGDKFVGGVKVDCSGKVNLWIQTKFLNQPLLLPLSSFSQSLLCRPE